VSEKLEGASASERSRRIHIAGEESLEKENKRIDQHADPRYIIRSNKSRQLISTNSLHQCS
jgi:hypothetical protein